MSSHSDFEEVQLIVIQQISNCFQWNPKLILVSSKTDPGGTPLWSCHKGIELWFRRLSAVFTRPGLYGMLRVQTSQCESSVVVIGLRLGLSPTWTLLSKRTPESGANAPPGPFYSQANRQYSTASVRVKLSPSSAHMCTIHTCWKNHQLICPWLPRLAVAGANRGRFFIPVHFFASLRRFRYAHFLPSQPGLKSGKNRVHPRPVTCAGGQPQWQPSCGRDGRPSSNGTRRGCFPKGSRPLIVTFIKNWRSGHKFNTNVRARDFVVSQFKARSTLMLHGLKQHLRTHLCNCDSYINWTA